MLKTALHFTKTDDAVPTAQINRYAEGWLLDSEIRQHSKQTLAIRRLLIKKLIWFLDKRGCDQCGTFELRQFSAYITNGQNSEDGRWDNARFARSGPRRSEPTTRISACSSNGWSTKASWPPRLRTIPECCRHGKSNGPTESLYSAP